MSFLRKILLGSVLFFSSHFVSSQNLNWSTNPQKGFVFQISNKEAHRLLTATKPDTIFKRLLRNAIDTFEVKTGWLNRPSKGHFILATIHKNKLHCEYTSVFPYQVFLLKEYNALALQVLGLDGTIRRDAKVKVGMNRVVIDTTTNTYRMGKSSFSGSNRFVTVELDGFRSVFRIEKQEVPSWANHYSYNSEDGPDFYSYMITDKNRYKPSERVRFKSYALSSGRTPLRKDLEIWLVSQGKPKKMGRLAPHRPGSYAGQIELHDSLKLQLDRFYTLQLWERSGRVVASCNFKFEDYELFGNNLQVELEHEKHYHPTANKLTIMATDVNGLMLKDAMATVIVKMHAIRETFEPVTVLRDTLLTKRLSLDPETPTVVEIPPSLFGKANASYSVDVIVTNSENQRMIQSLGAAFYYSEYEIISRFSNDSIQYELQSSGKPIKDVAAKIVHIGIDSMLVTLPFKEKINPVVPRVSIQSNLASRVIRMDLLTPGLKIKGGLVKDSFNISLSNPQRLQVSWFIYQGDELLGKGSGSSFEFKSAITDRSRTYYVELLYSFGGQENIKTEQYPFRDDKLTVSLEMPERVYPGQSVEALIKVEDQEGRPVSGVDLTAFAVTSKLGYFPPVLPYFGSTSTPRGIGASFKKDGVKKRTAVLDLDYKKWAAIARLDTMKYYQFTYPNKGIFRYTYEISDSTQFAPYVMNKGLAQQIYVIEVDRNPVYFSWVAMPPSYSFYVAPGKKHQITLRLYDRVLVLDSMQFDRAKKTILSLDLDRLPKDVEVVRFYHASRKRVNRELPQFTTTEIGRYTPFIAGFQPTGQKGYLESKAGFVPLFDRQMSVEFVNVGPIAPTRQTFFGQTSSGANLGPVSYQHIGGFNYQFQENVVYKTDAKNLFPNRLIRGAYDPSQTISDRVIVKKEFLEHKAPEDKWHATSIDLLDHSLRLSLLLPEEKERTGIAGILLQDCKTGEMISPCTSYSKKSGYHILPRGCYNVIVLYHSGRYLRVENVDLYSFTKVVINYKDLPMHPMDESSRGWLGMPLENCFKSELPPVRTFQMHSRKAGIGNVRGVVISADDNMPLPGVNVLVKGTVNGTVTDENGQFTLMISESPSIVVFSFIGFKMQEVEVLAGSVVSVVLQMDVQQLQEVVVVGYGTASQKSLTSSVSSVLSSFQSEPPEVEAPAEEVERARKDAEQVLYQELLSLTSIRSNFSDVGFWEPTLFTDRVGESRFKVKFPDDITRWNATVYAMNRRLQTGTVRENIKSYKPIMAEFHVPQFLTRGDSVGLVGKVLNYSQDSTIRGSVTWTIAGLGRQSDLSLESAHSEKFYTEVVSTDTLKGSFAFTRNDGYFDGERRVVPVIEQGVVRAEGKLDILNGNDIVHVNPTQSESTLVEILDSPIEVFARDVEYLLAYRYDCNEQLASKLIGLVNHKAIMRFHGKPFKYDKDINRIIARLLRNQNSEFLWSWWDVSPNTSYWMSAHILRALKTAQDAGYTVNLDLKNLARKATYKYEFKKNVRISDVDIVNALAAWKIELNYATLTRKLDSIIYWSQMVKDMRTGEVEWKPGYFIQKLLLLEVKQLMNVPFSLDSLLNYKKEGILADVSFSDGTTRHTWYQSELEANTVAYRMVKREPALHQLMMPMQLYFLKERRKNSWNTYHSSSVIMSVFPDFLKAGAVSGQVAKVKLTGKVNKELTQFPYRIELSAGEELQIEKQSGVPLYMMQYTTERVSVAKTGVNGFSIKTSFNKRTEQLVAGEPVDLLVTIEVKKDASMEFVMIEVPIPGSCSYNDKRQNGRETHREYFKEKAVIFCEDLKAGIHSFTVSLLPRFTGKFVLNPAQVSLMYVPVVNANTDLKTVRVN